MKIFSELNAIKSKDEFISFLLKMQEDKKNNDSEWENKSIESYLEAIASWTEDMDGYYSNMNLSAPKDIDWSFIATLFYVGKIYE